MVKCARHTSRYPTIRAYPLIQPLTMVLGILTSIAACPAIIGTVEAVQQGQRQSAKEKHRGLKTNLFIKCTKTSNGNEINGCPVVLSDNKVRCSCKVTVNPTLYACIRY